MKEIQLREALSITLRCGLNMHFEQKRQAWHQACQDIRLFAAQFDKTLLVQTGLKQNLQEIFILLLNADTNVVSTTMVSNQAFAII